VALARDRHTAEDALERIVVRYRPLPPVVETEKAAEPDAPLLHPAVGSNVVSDRAFRYGDPEAAFAAAAHRVSVTTRYPRNAASPLECFVVIAEYLPGEAAYEVTANFQGPFAMHPVMAMALGVPGNRLRLRTPPRSGGSFGAKHAVFPYVVLLALAARKAGRRSNGPRAGSSTSPPPRRRPTR
jgi:2-furoyl-CoA dehydrogenase large subunit